MKNKLKVLRAEMNISQEELANLSCLSRATINKIEQGRTIPNIDTAYRVCKVFNKSIEEVFLPCV